MRVLVLGERPSKKWGKSPSLKTLAKWIKVLNLQSFSFDNVIESPDEHVIKTDRIVEMVQGYDKIVTLGRVAAMTLAAVKIQGQSIQFFDLPHPSPLNRKLNSKKFVEDRLAECKRYLEAP